MSKKVRVPPSIKGSARRFAYRVGWEAGLRRENTFFYWRILRKIALGKTISNRPFVIGFFHGRAVHRALTDAAHRRFLRVTARLSSLKEPH